MAIPLIILFNVYCVLIFLIVCTDSSILHDIAVTTAESNIPMLKFLIGYPCCHPLLLAESSGYRGLASATPLKLAKHNQVKY